MSTATMTQRQIRLGLTCRLLAPCVIGAALWAAASASQALGADFPVRDGALSFRPAGDPRGALARMDVRASPLAPAAVDRSRGQTAFEIDVPVTGGSLGDLDQPSGRLVLEGGIRLTSPSGSATITGLRVALGTRERVVGRVNGVAMPIFVFDRQHPPTGISDDDFGIGTRLAAARLTDPAARALRRALSASGLRAGSRIGTLMWRAGLYDASVSLLTNLLSAEHLSPARSTRSTNITLLPVRAGSLSFGGVGRVALVGGLASSSGPIRDFIIDTRPETHGVYASLGGAHVRVATFDQPEPVRPGNPVRIGITATLTAEGSAELLKASAARLAATNPALRDRAAAELAPGADFAIFALDAPPTSRPVAIRLTAAQLRINQRISQAAVRRINALTARVDVVPPPEPGPGGAPGRVTLSAAQLLINQRISQTAVRRANELAGRLEGRLPTVSEPPKAGGTVTLSARQLLIGQRIAQAAVRRANALAERIPELPFPAPDIGSLELDRIVGVLETTNRAVMRVLIVQRRGTLGDGAPIAVGDRVPVVFSGPQRPSFGGGSTMVAVGVFHGGVMYGMHYSIEPPGDD